MVVLIDQSVVSSRNEASTLDVVKGIVFEPLWRIQLVCSRQLKDGQLTTLGGLIVIAQVLLLAFELDHSQSHCCNLRPVLDCVVVLEAETTIRDELVRCELVQQFFLLLIGCSHVGFKVRPSDSTADSCTIAPEVDALKVQVALELACTAILDQSAAVVYGTAFTVQV